MKLQHPMRFSMWYAVIVRWVERIPVEAADALVANGLKCVPACGNCRGSKCLNYDKTVGDTNYAELEEEEDTRDEDKSYDNILESLFN